MFYIYLDTSFLSNLTRVARGMPETSSNTDTWMSLLTLLRQGVKRGVLLCPASQFQTQEAMLAKGLIQEFVSLQLELSKGYYFKEWEDILVHQVANQALIYLGRPQDIDLGWSVFTKQLPPVIDPFATTIMKSNMTQDAESARLLREKFGREASYSEYYEEEKRVLLQETFLNPSSDLPEMLISKAKVLEKEVPTLFTFLDNESINHEYIDHVHFINIFCSLWTSTIVHERTRKYKEGDLLDVVALACAFPYCQIITTDSNMKNFVGRLRLDKKHGVSVYAPTVNDLDAFANALSELSSR